MTTFNVPQHLPQDLLLISEFVNVQKPQFPSPPLEQDNDDDVASSSSEMESEEEIEKDLTVLEEDGNEDGKPQTLYSSSSSEPDLSDSDSDSDLEVGEKTGTPKFRMAALGEDDNEDNVPAAAAYLQTKNEIVDAVVTIPEFDEVRINEELEKVGEIQSVIGDVVIVKGMPSELANRGSERALDSDTLLVFGDRKVMGYIYETFGPTSQPLYQIKFNQAYPLNPAKIQIGREVFHVPGRSHFVFVDQLKHFKGSDASNVHDEEPGEDEVEFSDDEAETAYRNRLKHKRGRDHGSLKSNSRLPTPVPSQMRDQDMMAESVLNKSAFDEHGPYDLDYDVGPSRPAPRPYDDPYSSAYDASTLAEMTLSRSSRIDEQPGRRRGKSFSQSSEGWGRGRGRSRGKRAKNYPRGLYGRGDVHLQTTGITDSDAEGYDPRMPQESLPSPYIQGLGNHAFNHSPSTNVNSSWGYPNQIQLQSQHSFMLPELAYQTPYGQPSTFVQPHINPRFAPALLGFQMAPSTTGHVQGLSGAADKPPTELAPGDQAWSEQWAVPTTDSEEFKEGPTS